jgi:hypothetical protein
MLITAIGLLLVVATAVALTWPLLSGGSGAPETTTVPVDPAARLRSEKDAVLAAIREADFDHETGKLSEEDYRILRAELEERALGALAALDRTESPPPPAGAAASAGSRASRAAFCPACGQKRKGEAEFCSRCGREVGRASSGERRRRA